MGHIKVNKITQGAMIAALFGVLSFLNTYTGSMFDLFIAYFMVMPIAWYTYKYGLKDASIVTIVAVIVIFMFGLPFFIISAISSCLNGLFIGFALKNKYSKAILFFGSFCVSLLNNIMIYEVLAGILNIHLVEEMSEMYQILVSYMPTLSNSISLTTFLSMIPLVLIVTSMGESYVVILITQLIFTRLKIEFPGTFHIASIHFSEKTGYILAILMFTSYICMHFLNINHIIIQYIYLLSMIGFIIDGLGFASLWLVVKGKGRLSGLLFLSLFIPLLSTVYTILGILDIFSELRQKVLYNK